MLGDQLVSCDIMTRKGLYIFVIGMMLALRPSSVSDLWLIQSAGTEPKATGADPIICSSNGS